MDDAHRQNRIRHEFHAVHRLVNRITLFGDILMADIQALNDKIAALSQFVTDDEAADDANEAALQAVIADLKAQIAAGAPPSDFQAQVDALDAVIAKLHTPAPVV